MKKVKIAFWIIIFGLVGLVIGQNWEFFKAENSLFINLFFIKYQTPYLANAVFFVAFFFLGLLLTHFVNMIKHYRDGKIIKTLKAKETNLAQTVSTLEKQLATQTVATETLPGAAGEDAPVEVVAQVK